MKKALVVLMLLAFVGGGLFAQDRQPTFTWDLNVEGGVGMVNRASDDEAIFGVMSPHTGVGGGRAQFGLTWANANNDAGARFGFRSNFAGGVTNVRHPTDDNNPNNLQILWAWAWARPWEQVEFRGGRGIDTRLDTFNPIHPVVNLAGDAGHTGFTAYFLPNADVTVGVGAISNQAVLRSDPSEPTWENDGMRLWGGLGLRFPDLVNIRAQIRFGEAATDLMTSFRILALDNMQINLSADFLQLDDFSDSGIMHFLGHLNFTGVEDLDLNLYGRFSMSQSDAHDDPRMSFGARAQYSAFGAVAPELSVWYVSGATYNAWGHMVWHAGQNGASTYNADHAFLSIRPAVEFRATSNSRVLLGCVINLDMGDVPAAGGGPDGDVSFGVFAGVRTNF